MFARKLEFDVTLDKKKEELLRKVRTDVMPVVHRQRSFIDILGLVHEMKEEKGFIISLWKEKKDFELYEREVFPKVNENPEARQTPSGVLFDSPPWGGIESRRLGFCQVKQNK